MICELKIAFNQDHFCVCYNFKKRKKKMKIQTVCGSTKKGKNYVNNRDEINADELTKRFGKKRK